jgi:hypothetical protein
MKGNRPQAFPIQKAVHAKFASREKQSTHRAKFRLYTVNTLHAHQDQEAPKELQSQHILSKFECTVNGKSGRSRSPMFNLIMCLEPT